MNHRPDPETYSVLKKDKEIHEELKWNRVVNAMGGLVTSLSTSVTGFLSLHEPKWLVASGVSATVGVVFDQIKQRQARDILESNGITPDHRLRDAVSPATGQFLSFAAGLGAACNIVSTGQEAEFRALVAIPTVMAGVGAITINTLRFMQSTDNGIRDLVNSRQPYSPAPEITS